jgi:hypothetical protein
MLIWCKNKWPEVAVPPGEPAWFYNEVETDTDCVIRMVNLYSDGRAIRDSIALSGGPSLVYADFWSDKEVRQFLTQISEEEFAEVWAIAADKSPRQAT